MNRDDIIRMAREAGFSEAWLSAGENPPHFEAPAVIVERFFQAAYAAGAAAEREACAQVCESMRPSKPEFDERYYAGCSDSAAAIRARGEK